LVVKKLKIKISALNMGSFFGRLLKLEAYNIMRLIFEKIQNFPHLIFLKN
jgi:hypothetical protein